MDETAGKAFIKGMNAKKREWASRNGVHQGYMNAKRGLRAGKNGVHQGYERQNEWMRQSKGRSSRV
ncbi:hypothetical protein PU629_15090 [Pullulanibacillus sp. KACC 23026]|uniref:hypothetical protein n=1 Tax=Pullulanibacillus sp. KACC 23026 TaxID=3028315 RepID=UPI0023AEBDD2|nr:hypothetical protein [Pullulanibacillus sp. KACC 23026]WEG11473.1 hypothetical protein PU629_15090 [Pullulanibacillus sp. KACC 23026]